MLEPLRKQIGTDSGSAVQHQDFDKLPGSPGGLDDDFPSELMFQRLDTVIQQIKQNLLDLDPVNHHRGKVFREITIYTNMPYFRLPDYQLTSFQDDFIYILLPQLD